ncbi:hypothetical protein HPB47_005473 [Ixodes persulcatus]|uniref:Uncharacterized protein n=1 Tax=Ixodes persulcatus TaxID=34615 RepID=A0AC60PD60_IXOPE|nr:hypothetical protein HPB47_005473 [Ixodes persulcatus]
MPRHKRRSSGSSHHPPKQRPTATASDIADLVPPAAIAKRLGDEFAFLPTAKELERRYQLMSKQLAQYGAPFDDQCTSSSASPCWLLDHQGPWNNAINHGGIELRCHLPGRLYLSMVPLSLQVAPTLRLIETTTTLLAVLWLLNNHRCIENVKINADIAFGILSRPFFSLVHFRAQVRHLQMIAWLPFDEKSDNDDLFKLALTDTRSLETLTLSGMALTDIATSNIADALARNESSLTYVSIRGIRVLRDTLEALLTTLHNCRRLKSLDLGFKVSCPGVLEPLEELLELNRDLEEFRYELNGPVRFPFNVLVKNRTLKTLSVGKEIFDEEDIGGLANTLTRNKRLRFLGISFCPLENLIAAWSAFSAGIASNTTLRELDMQRSDLNDMGAGFLAEALKINTTLQKLNVATGKLSANAAQWIAKTLLTNTSLQELRIGRVMGEKEDLAILLDVLQDPRVSHRVFRYYTRRQLPTLIKLMRQKCRQTEVHISGTEEVPPELASYFFFVLRVQKQLTKLTIDLNSPLMLNQARYLAALFRTSITLTDVELCIQTKGPEISILAKSIRQSSSIQSLWVRSWEFDLQSADAFIEMIKGNRSITHLTIFRCNEETDHVIARLGEALDYNYAITGIDLFDPYHMRIVCFHFLPQLRHNYFRLTRAAAFFKGVLCDQESAEDFRKLALSESLLSRLKEDRDSSEEEIKAAITEKLARLTL